MTLRKGKGNEENNITPFSEPQLVFGSEVILMIDILSFMSVSYTHLTLPTIYSV